MTADWLDKAKANVRAAAEGRVWALVTQNGGRLGFALCFDVPPLLFRERHERAANGGTIVDCFELKAEYNGISLAGLAAGWAKDRAAELRKPIPPPAPTEKTRPFVDLAPLPCPAHEDAARVARAKSRPPGRKIAAGGGKGAAGAARRSTGRQGASAAKPKRRAR